MPPAIEDEIESMRKLFGHADPVIAEGVLQNMRRGTKGEKLNSAAYVFVVPSNPFENAGRLGYEAQDRELLALMRETSEAKNDHRDDHGDTEGS